MQKKAEIVKDHDSIIKHYKKASHERNWSQLSKHNQALLCGTYLLNDWRLNLLNPFNSVPAYISSHYVIVLLLFVWLSMYTIDSVLSTIMWMDIEWMDTRGTTVDVEGIFCFYSSNFDLFWKLYLTFCLSNSSDLPLLSKYTSRWLSMEFIEVK